MASKKLVVQCPHPLVFIEPIVKKFEAATGIQTEVVAAGTGELLKRIEAESANPLGDVGCGRVEVDARTVEKFFESYHSPEEAAFFDDVRFDGKLTSFTQIPSVIMVNTKPGSAISRSKAIRTCSIRRSRGKIAHADPSKSSSSFEHLINMLYAMGKGDPDKGWAYVTAFAKNLTVSCCPLVGGL